MKSMELRLLACILAVVAGLTGRVCAAAEPVATYLDTDSGETVEVTDPDGRNDDGYTYLMQAAEYGACDAVEKMIAAGADIKAHSNDGTTPLLSAARNGCTNACGMMIDKGADPNAKNKFGDTPMTAAAYFGKADTFKYLAERGGDAFARLTIGATALFLATLKNEAPTVQAILDAAAAQLKARGLTEEEQKAKMAEYVNEPNEVGTTPLMNAAYANNPGMLNRLIELGADVNAKDENGITALLTAQMNRRQEAEKILVDAGAKE